MPSKKRKYEARFPPARIKKIMQTDEEIGKVAAAVPVIISRSLEIFLQSLVETTAQYTNERKAKTMTTSHLKHCIESEGKFDFLKDLVANIADIANEEDDGGDGGEKPKKQRKPRLSEKKKKKKESSSEDDSEQSDGEESGSAARSIPPSPNPSDDNVAEESPSLPIPKSKDATPATNLSGGSAEVSAASSPLQQSVPSPLMTAHHPPDLQPQLQPLLHMHPSSQGVSSPRHDGLSRAALTAAAFAHEQGSASPQYSLSREEVLDSSESLPRSASSSPHHSLAHQRELNLQHGGSSPNPAQQDPLYMNRSSPSHVMDMPFNPPSLQAASSFPPNLPPSADKASPTMPCGKSTASSLSLPLNNAASSLGARSSLNGSPRISSTTPNVPSPLLSSPRNVANPSNAASSPIYMPTEHRPTIIHSNVLERSEGAGRPARPSHSIDSIMGNIPSGPPKSQEEQKATISSSFMPNFNLHGNGASVPPSAPSLISNSSAPSLISNSNAPSLISNSNAPSLISNSFGMNFPSTFKVQNEEEDDDYDT